MKPSTSVHQVYINNVHLGSRLSGIKLPKQCYLLGLTREDQIFTLADDPIILEQDWLIAVALNKSLMPELDLCLKGYKKAEHS